MHPRGCGCVKISKKKRDVLILCQLSDAVRSAKEEGRGGLARPTQTTGDLPMQFLSSKKTALVCVTWASYSCEGEPLQGHCLGSSLRRCRGNTSHRTPSVCRNRSLEGENGMEAEVWGWVP